MPAESELVDISVYDLQQSIPEFIVGVVVILVKALYLCLISYKLALKLLLHLGLKDIHLFPQRTSYLPGALLDLVQSEADCFHLVLHLVLFAF